MNLAFLAEAEESSYLPAILDIVVIAFFAVFLILGYRKGFLKGLVGLIGTIVAFIVAYSCASMVVTFLENQFQLTTKVSSWFENILNEIEGFDVVLSEQNIEEQLEALGLPSFLSGMITEVLAGLELEQDVSFAQVLAPVFAGFFMIAIVGVLLFILIRLLLKLLANLLSGILDKIPVLGGVNHLLGALLGVVTALIDIYVILGVLSILPIEALQTGLDQTVIISWLYQTNLLMILIESLSSLSSITEYVQEFLNNLFAAGTPVEPEETASLLVAALV